MKPIRDRTDRSCRRAVIGACWACSAVAVAAALDAQEPSPSPHATMRGWADHTWLHILDRYGAADGRLSDLGILQRFQSTTEAEYALNLITNRFTLAEDYEWYRRERGFRWAGGSVTALNLMQTMEFKMPVRLTGGWSARLRFSRESDLPGDRDVLRLAIEHRWNGGLFAFFGTSLVKNKADVDMLVGGGWKAPGGEPAEISVTFGALDFANNYRYGRLNTAVEKTELQYDRFPYALRGTAEYRFAGRVRVEGHGAYMFPSELRTNGTNAPDSGFRQNETFGYVAGLVEYEAGSWASFGVLANHVATEIRRTQLPEGSTEDNFTRTERGTSVGPFVMLRPLLDWTFEGWLARNWRPEEKRFHGASPDPGIDYEDRAWMGMGTVTYGKSDGFSAAVGLVVDFRDVIRGQGQVDTAEDLDRDNTRLRFDVGWRLEGRGYVYVGTALDLDSGDGLRRPDAYRARFAVEF